MNGEAAVAAGSAVAIEPAFAGAADGARAVNVRRLGRVGYEPTWHAMQDFTAHRTGATPDELWQVEHPPVYTVGIAGRREHLPRVATDVPIVHVDRGGQITYHGPGQVVVYTLLDLDRLGLGVRSLVRLLESAVIDLLARHGVRGEARTEAPGVYVAGAKIAALGLRIRRGCCYHGLALNVDMDLAPFQRIDPCGYPGLAVTRTRDLGIDASAETLGDALTGAIAQRLQAAAKALA